jgi:hypothetical protein
MKLWPVGNRPQEGSSPEGTGKDGEDMGCWGNMNIISGDAFGRGRPEDAPG